MASDDPDLFSVAMLIDELKVGAPSLSLARLRAARRRRERARSGVFARRFFPRERRRV